SSQKSRACVRKWRLFTRTYSPLAGWCECQSKRGPLCSSKRDPPRAPRASLAPCPPRGAGRPGRQLGFQLLAPPLAFTEAVRLPVENQNVRPVRNPVQQCCRQRRVAKHLLPAGKLQVAGHDEAAGLVPFRHELEEQRRPRPQPQVPQFVTDDQVELLPALEGTIQTYLP